MKKAIEAHIKKIGAEKFDAALAAATFVIRTDARLVGMNKIREPLALTAACRATGLDEPEPCFATNEIQPSQEFVDMCHEILAAATEAATGAAS